ncbi:MAG: hypothetical protein NZU63_13235 [Gemmataceae bacterium]|nr:hypothetical protein [Gemmataceae bacterium]MDW8241625.1 hypothetical protein [Thermogemmata sp.]
MWQSIRRWLDWHRHERQQGLNLRTGFRSLRWGYEVAKLAVWTDSIPWFAEAVLLRLVLSGQAPLVWRRTDFMVRWAEAPPAACQDIHLCDNDQFELEFRLTSVPPPDMPVIVYWRDQAILSVHVPRLSLLEYLHSLRWHCSGVTMRCGQHAITARCFSRRSLRSLAVAAVVTSPYTLVPLAQLQPFLRIQAFPVGQCWEMPLNLTADQQLATEACLIQPFPPLTPQYNTWSLEWRTSHHRLHAETINVVRPELWERDVTVLDTCFVVGTAGGWVRQRELPAPKRGTSFGPCFILQAPGGSAGLIRLNVYAHTFQRPLGRLLRRETVLVTDAPTVYLPGMFQAHELPQLTRFELRTAQRTLATLPLSHAPHARLTAEGGFVSAPDFVWTEATEAELLERLNRLSRRPSEDKQF